MKNKEIIPPVLLILLSACGAILFYYQSEIFLPVVIALILAYLFNPLVTVVEKRGIGRAFAIALVFTLVLVLLAALALTVFSTLLLAPRLGVHGFLGYLGMLAHYDTQTTEFFGRARFLPMAW